VTTLDTRPTADVTPIDARGPRFGAVITTLVLAVVLLALPSPLAALLLAGQAVVFAIGALVGPQAQPYGVLFRRVVRPRLAPPTRFEDPRPPRFAQAVGLGFALVALVAFALGATAVAYVAVAFALAAAFLNAVFDYCLGCEMYLLGRRLLARTGTA
jgi:hypothetical protein